MRSLGHCDYTQSKSFHVKDFPNDYKQKHFSLRVELSPYIIAQSKEHRRKLLHVTKIVHIKNLKKLVTGKCARVRKMYRLEKCVPLRIKGVIWKNVSQLENGSRFSFNFFAKMNSSITV